MKLVITLPWAGIAPVSDACNNTALAFNRTAAYDQFFNLAETMALYGSKPDVLIVGTSGELGEMTSHITCYNVI
jgi:hypothetical protein